MPRGGKRKGAGRPKGTGKFGEPTKAVRLPVSMIERIMKFIDLKGFVLPLSPNKGVATPNADKAPELVNLLDAIVPGPAASTFLVRAADDSLNGMGILVGDLLVADNSLTPENGNVVVAIVNGKITIKRYAVKGKKVELKAENAKYAPIKIADESELEILGVVVTASRKVC